MEQANEAWIAMFRRIPASLHDTLAWTLRTGTEIVIQRILKLEPDFAIVRRRVSGTQDAGRVVLIPYAQLTFVSITRPLKDAEVEAIFGTSTPPAFADLPTAPAVEAHVALPEAPRETAEGATMEPLVSKKPEHLKQSALITKLRDRLKDSK